MQTSSHVRETSYYFSDQYSIINGKVHIFIYLISLDVSL